MQMNKLSEPSENPDIQTIIITKNDNIQRKLDAILRGLLRSNETPLEEVMILAKGESIQKMITIVEILKQKITEKTPISIGEENVSLPFNSYLQYSKIDSISVTLSQTDPDMAPVEVNGKEFYTKEQLNQLKPQREEKIPIFKVIFKLFAKENSHKDVRNILDNKEVEFTGWSCQKSI